MKGCFCPVAANLSFNFPILLHLINTMSFHILFFKPKIEKVKNEKLFLKVEKVF